MHDLHDIIYGIFPHNDPNLSKNRPMASVAYHPKEEYCKYTLLDDSMHNYIDKSIYEFFHISYIEYVELPHDIVSMLNEIAMEKINNKQKTISDIEKDLEKEIGK